ncbi:MAG: hypothetical protein JSS81_18800 [Acidobacteria bacterium]|nr:hypothetical protein [Acidobacteriota bacterium]
MVDGATAYKDRKFQVAEQLFRKTVDIDPNGETMEGKTAQLFLARTLHSEFISDRKRTDLAEQAVQAYEKVLQRDVNDQGSFKALASLMEVLDRKDEALQRITERAGNEKVNPAYRAEAYTSLAARKYSCANDISDNDPVKKTVKKDGKDVYQYNKPEKQEDFDKLKGCAQDGLDLVEKALAMEPPEVKQMKDLNLKSMTPADIDAKEELLKIFSSAWSYKANLLYQKMRIAEMDKNETDKASFKSKGDEARSVFTGLNEVEKNMDAEKDARKKAEEEKNSNKK